VLHLLELGKRVNEIARLLEIDPATVSYHKRKLGFPPDERFARRYDWDAVQGYYDAGHTVRECMENFGFSSASWTDAVDRGAIRPRPQALPLEQLLVRQPRARRNIKFRLISAGLKEPACEICGLESWQGKNLSLELHHRNGERHDNRLENLALLCPNCHSQTHTWGGKNKAGGIHA
jgi:HNH endonuclease